MSTAIPLLLKTRQTDGSSLRLRQKLLVLVLWPSNRGKLDTTFRISSSPPIHSQAELAVDMVATISAAPTCTCTRAPLFGNFQTSRSRLGGRVYEPSRN